MTVERVFLDANILVSAALKPESRLAGLWHRRNVRLLASPHVVDEARRNCVDPHTAKRLDELLASVSVLPRQPADFQIADDPGLPAKDRPVLLAAIVARADVLLTGDLTHFGGCMGRTYDGVTVPLPSEYLHRRDRR